MTKKLIVLFLLLAVLTMAGSAQAAVSWWKNVAAGNWETSTNWSTLPSNSTTASAYNSAGGASSITVTTGGTAYKLYMVGAGTYPATATTATVTVSGGANLNIAHDVFMYSTVAGATSTLLIQATGTVNAVTAGTATYSFTLTGNLTSTKSTDTVQVYGNLNIGTTGTVCPFVIGDASSSTGHAVVDIYNGGVVQAEKYSIRTNTANPGKIYIESGGKMWINGNVTATVATDVTNHRIQQGTFDTNGGFISATDLTSANYGYDATHGSGETWIAVPEPATVALLGLGGLLLLKRKRR